MIFKKILIFTLTFTFIKINDGMNVTWDIDDQDLFFPSHDFSIGPPSPGEEMFRELFGTPADQINEEIHGESSRPTAGIQNVIINENETLQWAQDIFLQEYHKWTEYKFWKDLANEVYVQSWSVLCYQLWDKHPNTKRGEKCNATRFYDFLNPNYQYRVVIPNNKKRYKVDLLQCKCPTNSSIPMRKQKLFYSGLYFFVTPCTEFRNSYYIMRQISRGSLEVYDIRNTTFNPEHNIHVLVNETNQQTYGQPGTTRIQYDPKDERENEKLPQQKFLEEFGNREMEKSWDDLRNEAYNRSWAKLCFLLLDNETNKKTEGNCKTKLIHKKSQRSMRHRIENPNVDRRMYADILLCKCPMSVDFYVTKCDKEPNCYYIMRLKPVGGSTLEVYDLRSVNFHPGFIP